MRARHKRAIELSQSFTNARDSRKAQIQEKVEVSI